MNKELEEKLFKKYPTIFPNGRAVDPKVSLMCFGIEPEDGWYKIIDTLCSDILKCKDGDKVVCVQVKEKFGCYDEQTEVLTEDGWKHFKDIIKEDKIATLKDGKIIEYEKPKDIISYSYNGKMYHLKTRGIDICVTPNHNLYTAREPTINGKYSPPKYKWFPFELTSYTKYLNKNKVFKKDGIWEGTPIETITIKGYNRQDNYTDKTNRKHIRNYIYKDRIFKIEKLLKFLGWYVAEGYYRKGNISICLNYKNKKELNEVIKLASDLGLKNKLNPESGIIRIYDKIFGEWLKEQCGHLAKNKKVPKFIKSLPPNFINVFLECLYKGDGYKSTTANTLYTISKKLSDDVQELIFKNGQTSSIQIREPKASKLVNGKYNCYCINWMTNSNLHQTQEKGLAKSSFEGLIDYSGKVFCVEVSNHIIYVRRNGKSYWCGNSLRFYTNGAPEEVHNLIYKAEEDSFHICEDCGEQAETQNVSGWYRTLCKECLDKHKTKRFK